MKRDPQSSRVHGRSSFRKLLTGGVERPARRLFRRAQRISVAHPGLRIARIVLGWILIVLGIAGIVLPLLPAVVLIPAGVALVGRHSIVIQWARTRVKLLLRLAETWKGWFGRVGRWLAQHERRFSKLLRDRRLRRFAR